MILIENRIERVNLKILSFILIENLEESCFHMKIHKYDKKICCEFSLYESKEFLKDKFHKIYFRLVKCSQKIRITYYFTIVYWLFLLFLLN